MTDDEDERPPDFLAAFDQVLRGVADVARIVRAYYLALIECGFSEAEAMVLTVQYQTGLQRTGGS